LTLNSPLLLLYIHPFSLIDSLFLLDSLLTLIFLLLLLLILLIYPSSKDSLGAKELGHTSILLAYAYNAILAFLDATDIGLRVNNNEREEEEAHNQDS
jgi:hypothetical protein